MNLLADECVDLQIVERLRQDGHNVLYIAEMEPGIGDDEILSQANERRALLVTADKDFGELVFRLGRLHAGVVLVRLVGIFPEKKAEIVAEVFHDHAEELRYKFTVISPGIVRIRAKG
jgi:predicted nuclease of predicted toxin-antitoxin system